MCWPAATKQALILTWLSQMLLPLCTNPVIRGKWRTFVMCPCWQSWIRFFNSATKTQLFLRLLFFFGKEEVLFGKVWGSPPNTTDKDGPQTFGRQRVDWTDHTLFQSSKTHSHFVTCECGSAQVLPTSQYKQSCQTVTELDYLWNFPPSVCTQGVDFPTVFAWMGA